MAALSPVAAEPAPRTAIRALVADLQHMAGMVGIAPHVDALILARVKKMRAELVRDLESHHVVFRDRLVVLVRGAGRRKGDPSDLADAILEELADPEAPPLFAPFGAALRGARSELVKAIEASSGHGTRGSAAAALGKLLARVGLPTVTDAALKKARARLKR